jgi:hypothetical protein
LDQARRRFPTCEEGGITGDCYIVLTDAEISASTADSMAYKVVHEVALDADPQIQFRVELSRLGNFSRGAYFIHYSVSRRIEAKEVAGQMK